MKIFNNVKIVAIIASILLTQIPHTSHAGITSPEELAQTATKKVIIGCFALASSALLYQGVMKFVLPKFKLDSKEISYSSWNEKCAKAQAAEKKVQFFYAPISQKKNGFLLSGLGAGGLLASWFANKYL